MSIGLPSSWISASDEVRSKRHSAAMYYMILKLWPRVQGVESRARTLWADECLREPEWARESQSESERANCSGTLDNLSMHYNTFKNCGSSVIKRQTMVLFLSKMSLTRCEPKKWKICVSNQPCSLSRPVLKYFRLYLYEATLSSVKWGWGSSFVSLANLPAPYMTD